MTTKSLLLKSKLIIALKVYKIFSSTSDLDAVNNFKLFNNKILFSAFSLTFKIVLIKDASSKINETIFSNYNFLEFMISLIIRSEIILTLDFLRLKIKQLVKAEKVMIEAVLDRKNRVSLLNFKNFCEVKEESIILNVDVFKFDVDILNSIVVALFFVFDNSLTYSRSEKIFV